ncbi:MAG TPA: acyl-CoA dehydrogenase family protein [Sporichthyaceae bacterium]
MSSFRRTLFAEEHDDFRAMVREFLFAEAVPHTAQWERDGIIGHEFWRKAAGQGMVGFAAPEEYGGAGIRDFRFNTVIIEEVVRTGAVGDAFGITNDIVMPYLLDIGTPEQHARWLPRITSGEAPTAIAMSEPGMGSDLRGIATTARKVSDGWSLSGSKTFITNGILAELLIIAAKVPDADNKLGLFVVEGDAAGFTKGRKLDKIGRRATDTAELFLDDVFVPDADVLGVPGKGLHYLMANLAQERLSITVGAMAHAERALELALDYAKTRKAFGQPIGTFQANRFTLAELHTKISSMRCYVDRAIELHCAGELSAADAAGSKFLTTELEFEALDKCLQIHGGYGYMEEYEIARRWRDARVQQIYGGTNQIMREIVGRDLGL